MSAETLTRIEVPGVAHLAEPFVDILHTNKVFGNVDTRPEYGTSGQVTDSELAFNTRKELFSLLNYRNTVLQKVQMSPDFLDLGTVSDPARVYTTDGLITERPGELLNINTGDCPAVVMWDAKNGSVLSLFHAGRQGVDGNIHVNIFDYLTDSRNYQVPKEDLKVHIAPSVHADSYYYPTISPKQLFDPRWQSFIEAKGGNFHIDL
jgi:copper oxidase (laccase) domain-containing protein